MKKNKKIFTVLHQASAVFMILALMWLTVSISFVYNAQLKISQLEKVEKAVTDSEEEAPNPFGSTEEKAPTNTSLSEEYIHHSYISDYFFYIDSEFHKPENAGTYTAFHGELLVPPPNQA
jgi:hypothetical protein